MNNLKFSFDILLRSSRNPIYNSIPIFPPCLSPNVYKMLTTNILPWWSLWHISKDNIEMVISEYPDDDEADDMDSPISYLNNAVGDIQDAINLLEQE